MGLKITACLAWYAERPVSLARCVGSLTRVCDALVAVDGRWSLFPGEATVSAIEEAQMIEETAAIIGVDLTLVRDPVEYVSQVAKRDELMRLGAATGADWLLVIDGDERLECVDPERLRAVLASVDEDVAQVNCRHIGDGVKQRARPIRRLYRASTGVRVETAHNGYRTADGRWLHGDPAFVTLEPALDLSELLTVEHDGNARPRSRRGASKAYRVERARGFVEAWA